MDKEICPQCFGTKKYYESKRKHKDCELCDDNGMVDSIVVDNFIESLI